MCSQITYSSSDVTVYTTIRNTFPGNCPMQIVMDGWSELAPWVPRVVPLMTENQRQPTHSPVSDQVTARQSLNVTINMMVRTQRDGAVRTGLMTKCDGLCLLSETYMVGDSHQWSCDLYM